MSRRRKSCQATAAQNTLTFLRLHYGLTQEQLAKKCGLTVLDIGKCERKQFTVQLYKLQRIASFFHVPLNAILYDRFDLALPSLRTPAVIRPSAKTAIRQRQIKSIDNGLCGEEYVLAQERKKLAGTMYENAIDPHYSLDPGYGFDLLSFTADGELLYIEVKTTSGKAEAPFFMSANEKLFMEQCRSAGLQYELHRVYDIDRHPRQLVYTLDDLRHFQFITHDYLVKEKKAI